MLSRLHLIVLIMFFFVCNTIAAPGDDKENETPQIKTKLEYEDTKFLPRKRIRTSYSEVESADDDLDSEPMISDETTLKPDTKLDIRPLRKAIRKSKTRTTRVAPVESNTFSDDAKWQTCFTPRERCVETLISALDQAKESVYLQAYVLSSQEIADALVRAHQRGVKVRALVDHAQINVEYAKLHFLDTNNVAVYIDILAILAHNKVIVIDNEIVVTGSYNFSNAAEKRNVENYIIIHDPKVAKSYLESFIDRYQDSLRYKNTDKSVSLQVSPNRPQTLQQMRIMRPFSQGIQPMKLEFAN